MKYVISTLLLIVIILIALALTPVPIISEDEAEMDTGIVTRIHEGQGQDVVFRLDGNSNMYYINRGLESGLNISDLKNRLIGKEVILKYPNHWTPMNWKNNTHHVSQLEFKNEVIYSEFIVKE